MKVYIIDNLSSSIEHLEQLISETISKPKVIKYNQLDHDDINPQDIVILSGSHEHTAIWNGDIFKNEVDIIKHHKGMLIGVCLGHQLIAHAYGSHVHKLPERLYGLRGIRPTIETDLMDGIEDASVFESHNWSIQKINDPLIELASSDAGIEILKHKNKPTFGVQFHPEALNTGDGRVIFERIIKEIGLTQIY